jgi:hypothetical protein
MLLLEKPPLLFHLILESSLFGLVFLPKPVKGNPFGRMLQFRTVLFRQLSPLRLMMGIQLLALRFLPLQEFR